MVFRNRLLNVSNVLFCLMVPLYWRDGRHLYSQSLQTFAAHTKTSRRIISRILGWNVPLIHQIHGAAVFSDVTLRSSDVALHSRASHPERDDVRGKRRPCEYGERQNTSRTRFYEPTRRGTFIRPNQHLPPLLFTACRPSPPQQLQRPSAGLRMVLGRKREGFYFLWHSNGSK